MCASVIATRFCYSDVYRLLLSSLMLHVVLSNTDIPLSLTYWTKQEFPNPQVDVSRCGRRGKASWVCDPNHVVSFDSAVAMDDLADGMRNTGCWCDCSYNGGPEIAVALVPRVKTKTGFPATEIEMEAAVQEFAQYLLQVSWLFSACNDIAIIVLSSYEKQVATGTGSQLRQVLTDSCVATIRSEAMIYITNNSYARGVLHIMGEYRKVLAGQRTCVTGQSTSSSSTGFSWFIVPVVLFVVVIIILASINPMSRYISGRDLVPWCESTGRGHRVGVAFAGGARGRRSTIGVGAGATWGLGMNNVGAGGGGGGIAWSTGMMENGAWTMGGGGNGGSVQS